MKHPIDPKVDCVFKALLGTEENRNLLLHFINAILDKELAEPLVWVDILNPYNEREFIGDKLSVVDVKAKDEYGRLYQIEIQLLNYGSLPARIIYNWADIYSSQLQTGHKYDLLKPTYAIWLLAEDLIKNNANYVHNYKLRDTEARIFSEHGGIWILELNKFSVNQVNSEDQRWLKFFKDGENLDDQALPDWMTTQEMRQAMSTLSLFSEKERQYHEYQARQEYLREQHAIQSEFEQMKLEKQLAIQELVAEKQRAEAAIQREEIAIQREETARLEIERLKALLKQEK